MNFYISGVVHRNTFGGNASMHMIDVGLFKQRISSWVSGYTDWRSLYFQLFLGNTA